MRPQNKIKSWLALGFMSIGLWGAEVSAETVFRTPAKRYGAAYSVKLNLKKGLTNFVAPVWIRPDVAESSLDYNQMKTLGWAEPINAKKPLFEFDDVTLVGSPIEKTSFKSGKADLAFYPQFPKGCCFGTLGRDVLSKYRLKFVPAVQSEIIWIQIDAEQAPQYQSAFLKSLASLFTIRTEQVLYSKKTIDTGVMAYTLDLSQNLIEFEPAPLTRVEKELKPFAKPIFTFEFVPPFRKLEVISIDPSFRKSAQAVGLKVGSEISKINSQFVLLFSEFEVVANLKGRRSAKITLNVDGKDRPITFDFVKKEFLLQ